MILDLALPLGSATTPVPEDRLPAGALSLEARLRRASGQELEIMTTEPKRTAAAFGHLPAHYPRVTRTSTLTSLP